MNLIGGQKKSQRKDHHARRMIETDYYHGENTNIAVCGARVRRFAWGNDHGAILPGLQGLPKDYITFDHPMLTPKCISRQVIP